MTRRRLFRAFPLLAAALSGAPIPAARAATLPQRGKRRMLYIGTYAGENQPGIYIYSQDAATGDLTLLGEATGVAGPSFLAFSPDRKRLYAACENGGQIAAFNVDTKTGLLALINKESAAGGAPCHVSVSHDGKCVLAANYGSGNIVSLPVQANGGVGPVVTNDQHKGGSVNANRQKEPHAHSVNVDPSGKFAIAADLGTDKLYVYKLDTKKATLTPNQPASTATKPGAGPRHFSFHPNGKFGYGINELDNTITLYSWDGSAGTLTLVDSFPTLPDGFAGNNSTAEVKVHPNGQFVYGSNRGDNSIAVFRVDTKTGKLTPVAHTPTGGKTPRNFNLSPDGKFMVVANQDSGNLVVFRVDPKAGTLTPTGKVYEVPKPVCIVYA